MMDNSSEKFDGRICMLFFCFYIRALQILSLVGTPLISFFILQKLQKVQEFQEEVSSTFRNENELLKKYKS
jgi:hypothetical protein